MLAQAHVMPMPANQTLAEHEPCPDHAAMMGDDALHMQTAMNADTSQQHSTSPDCCQSVFCKCPCVQALALSIALPTMEFAAPDSLAIPSFDTPLLYTGASDLFRPPI